MSELKKVRIREAKQRDIGLFRKLWARLLEQNAKEGSIIQANNKSLSFYEKLFNSYIEKELEGIVLFVADKAVLMWGDTASLLDFPGKLIMGWGMYIEPEFKDQIYGSILDYILNWCKKHDFTGILVEEYEHSIPHEKFDLVSTLKYKEIN